LTKKNTAFEEYKKLILEQGKEENIKTRSRIEKQNNFGGF